MPNEEKPLGEWQRFGYQLVLIAFAVFAALGFAVFVTNIAHRLGY